MKGKPPDYQLGALLKAANKEDSPRSYIGAGWTQDDGRIYIKLDPFVVLKGSEERLILTLFPKKDD